MNKFKIKRSFQNKNFKYGGTSAVLSVIVIAVLICINLFSSKFNYKFDMTKNKLFSLSDQTYSVLKSVKKDVTLYVLSESASEDSAVRTILDKYKSHSDKIKVEYKDPVKYPEFAKKYSTDGTEINAGSIIAVSGSKYRVIDSNEIINVTYDESGQAQADSLAIEQLVTGAVIYVTSDKNPVIITLQGHEEEQLSAEASKQLGLENYTVKEMDLLTKDAKLSPDDTLLIYSPKKDLSKDEAAKIKEFLANGGRAFFMMDIAENDMPNFLSVFSSYGVGIKRAVIVDGDASHSSENQIYLLPEYSDHEIVSSIAGKNLKTLLPAAQALDLLKNKKDTTVIDPLLTTSANSWGKVNLNSETLDKEKGDLTGPFTLAAAITDTPKDTSKKAAKLVVVSNGYFADTQVISSGGNLDFFMNCVNWLQDKKESITIRPKSLQSETITISVLQRLAVSFFVVILIPLTVIIIGAVKVLKRKRL